VITSLTSGWRGAACRRGLVTAAGNSAEGIPRGNIRGGRDPLAGGPRTEMQHYTAHVTWPRRRAARVISTQRDFSVRSDDLQGGS
jgi:hypothetical protein